MQARKAKYYKILSFKYDFNFENDRVQFCSSYPYSTQTLEKFVNGIHSQKVNGRIFEVVAGEIFRGDAAQKDRNDAEDKCDIK